MRVRVKSNLWVGSGAVLCGAEIDLPADDAARLAKAGAVCIINEPAPAQSVASVQDAPAEISKPPARKRKPRK
jgi:hypothetical protein